MILLLLLPCFHNSQAAETDPVLIPYIKEDLLSPDGKPGEEKVFVPKSVFRELMAKAHPGESAETASTCQTGMIERISPPKFRSPDKSPVFTLTLPKAEKVDIVRFLLPNTAEIFTRYRIELSEDGSNYETVADRSQGQLSGWQRETFAPRFVKSVRVSGVCNAGDFSVSLIEVYSPPSTVGVAPGNAFYELTVAENTWQCKGTLDIATFDPKAWIAVPLDFGLCEVVSASIDGQPVSVAHERGVPFVQINRFRKTQGRSGIARPAHVDTRSRAASGTFCQRHRNASGHHAADRCRTGHARTAFRRMDRKNADAKTQRCEIDLGGLPGAAKSQREALFQSRDVELSWHSADIRGKAATQIAARNIRSADRPRRLRRLPHQPHHQRRRRRR